MSGQAQQRLAVLDGLRGVAALLVMVHHISVMTTGRKLVPNGYLAVDFFFLLSGFVMARAYEPRLAAGLGFEAFMRARLRRLYPTIAVGIACGALANVSIGVSPGLAIVLLSRELLFVPLLRDADGGIYRLDGVQWSLLFELLANALHAGLFWRLRATTLSLLALGAAIGLIATVARYGTIGIGDRGGTFAGGLPRVLCPYLLGIVLARLPATRLPRVGLPWRLPSRALVVAAIGGLGLVPSRADAWWIELAVTLLVFPVLLVCGATMRLGARLDRWAEQLGALSFPLYALHLPVALLLSARLAPALGQGAFLLLLTAAGVVASAAVLPWLLAAASGRRRPAVYVRA